MLTQRRSKLIPGALGIAIVCLLAGGECPEVNPPMPPPPDDEPCEGVVTGTNSIGTVVNIMEVCGGSPVAIGGPIRATFMVEKQDGTPMTMAELDRFSIFVSGPTDKYQRVIPPPLAVPRRNRHRRRITVQIERCLCQTAQFARSQTRFNRQPIEQRPLRPGHPVAFRPTFRRVQQRPQFVDRERPSLMPSVCLDVQPVQVGNRRFQGPPVLHHPAAELLDRLDVEIERLGR